MSNTTTKVQVPMDTRLRDALAKLAEERGFDSIQAYIRFWAKNAVAGRAVEFHEDLEPWPVPPQHVIDRWEREIEEAENDPTLPRFKTAKEALDHLHNL